MNPEFLNSFRLETTEVKFEDINEAADACEEETAACRGVTHRHLFTLLRSGFMASERNCQGLFEDPENGSGAIYWAEDAGGSGDLKCVEQVTPETIQAFLSSLLAELEWGPLQTDRNLLSQGFLSGRWSCGVGWGATPNARGRKNTSGRLC